MVAGRPHHVILEQAEEVRADLIVIGPHRERSTEEDRLGITADRLVRTSDVPCLIIHSPINLPLRSVCVPNDLSLAAQGALDVALVWAAALRMPRSTGGRTRLNVVNIAAEVDGAPIERQLEKNAIDSARRTGCGAFLEIRQAARTSDATAAEIVRFAEENDSDLLVLGTHGQSALARELIGGVSSAVARLATCPVLLVPPPTWKLLQARQDEIPPN
jgi:nucleotide-binding universal stress UspA family protein